MKVPYSWLKEYVDVKLEPEKLATLLTMAGLNVNTLDKIAGDYIFEFEITANRSDCLSIIGVAREVAALLGKRLKIPKELTGKPMLSKKTRGLPLEIEIKDPDLCYFYAARIIKDVEVGPSPDWLKERIISVGLRPVNNIVDITNYVLFETGQPMHTFDFDKIKGGLTIRRAKKGENIITIDNVARAFDENTLVIADETGPVALAGVMGGLATEVTDMTKNILLESAFFNPVSIRRTSRAMGEVSESSYRFERKIDKEMVVKASERASSLIEELGGGRAGSIIEIDKKKSLSRVINFDIKKSNSVLGVSIEKNKVTKILKSLGFGVVDKKDTLKVTVPSFREDVKSEIDITEEVSRIYGYEKIPATIPAVIGNTEIKDFTDILNERINKILVELGLNEIITYSLISKNKIKGLGIPDGEIVTIKNPLSIDQEIMRPTLLPGMLIVSSRNINRKASRISLFEIGKVYKEKDSQYREETVLSIGLSGKREESWKTKKEDFDYFDLKGIIERLLEGLGIHGSLFKKEKLDGFDPSSSSVVTHDEEIIASLGGIDEEIAADFDVEKKLFYGEIYIERLMKKVNLDKKYSNLPRYPSVMRDISIVGDENLAFEQAANIIEDVGRKLVKGVTLIDYYKGKQIPSGKHALLYRIEYRSDEKTLEDREVDELQNKIKSILVEKLNISFR